VVVPTKNVRHESSVSADVTQAEVAFDDGLRTDLMRSRTAMDVFRRELEARNVQFGNKPLPTSIKGHFVARSRVTAWNRVLTGFLRVLEGTALRFLQDPEFRRNGPFSPEALELLDIDPGYSHPAVVCRPDLVWEGDRVGLLEMNADSPAMMLYADVVQDVQRELFPLNEIDEGERLRFDRRIPDMLEALRSTYREWGGKESSPVIAIVDWAGQKTSAEQENLARQFTALGCPAFVCSPDQLEVRGGRLLGRGEPIDIVQRRVLFPDIVRRRAELDAFLTAYKERLACVINPLRSYVVGCKAVLAEMCRPERIESLDDEDREVVRSVLPCTMSLDEIDRSELADRTRWVIKPTFGSGGSGVIIGRYVDESTWNEAIARARPGEWVVQRYLRIPLYRVPLMTSSASALVSLYSNWNPFFFGGVASGGITRVSSDPVVGISARGALLPTIIVNDE
jgi:uncharacterized circularly permuted ATP-grasp superfamily protein